jgi:hypothetical protein
MIGHNCPRCGTQYIKCSECGLELKDSLIDKRSLEDVFKEEELYKLGDLLDEREIRGLVALAEQGDLRKLLK